MPNLQQQQQQRQEDDDQSKAGPATSSHDPSPPSPADPLANLLHNYHSLNATLVDELPDPSALDFLRHVALNRPFVSRGAARDWPAVERWDAAYLRRVMRNDDDDDDSGDDVGGEGGGGALVQVAVTPHGNADAIVERADGSLVFVEPYEIRRPFGEFLDHVRADTEWDRRARARARDVAHPDESERRMAEAGLRGRNVQYAQTQNNNLHTEYQPLLADLPPSIPFARIALDQTSPDAMNFWLGNERSTTALHRDGYENVYVQIRGRKHFTLLPPVALPGVNEQRLVRGRYVPANRRRRRRRQHPDDAGVDGDDNDEGDGDGSSGVKDGKGEEGLNIVVDETAECVPVPTWDPDDPTKHATRYSHLLQPLRVTLEEGDLLYLPALWYHKVAQSSGEEGFACAVNYWYDMEFGGGFWSGMTFVREVMEREGRQVVYPDLKTGGEDEEEEGGGEEEMAIH